MILNRTNDSYEILDDMYAINMRDKDASHLFSIKVNNGITIVLCHVYHLTDAYRLVMITLKYKV